MKNSGKKEDKNVSKEEKGKELKKGVKSLLGSDKELEKLRYKYEESGMSTLELGTTSEVGLYDPKQHGAIVKEEKIPDEYEVVDEYWIERPFSKIWILRTKETGELQYHLIEPNLSKRESKLMHGIWKELRDRLPYEKITEEKTRILQKHFMDIVEDYEISETKTLHKLLYYLIRNNLGYGKADPLMKDENIEDISCDGVKVPIYIYHRDHYNLRTNISFEKHEIDSFVTKLAEKCGEHISYADPVVESKLPDGSRLQATLGSEVTTKGSSFTIRKFTGGTFTPPDLIKYGTFDAEMLATLWMAIENGRSLMVVGGTAVGKTSTLNALGFFIPPDSKVVSIEDTRELSLYQENWLPNLTREATGGENLDMHELVRKAMRQRPECLIVGEVRGREALAMFQAMSTGHTAFSTMHAGSIQDCINRLLGEPINLPRPMLGELDIVCLQLLTTLGKKRVRRNNKIMEILGIEPESEKFRTVETYSWELGTDSFQKKEESQVLREIRESRGMSFFEMSKEIENRSKLLQYLAEKPRTSYEEIASLIRQYYFEPEKALEKISTREK